jgi:hypothetical protein
MRKKFLSFGCGSTKMMEYNSMIASLSVNPTLPRHFKKTHF